MICKGCGKVIEDWNYTCPFCGAKTQSNESDAKTTSGSTNSIQNDEKHENVISRPDYLASDDEVEVLRAKWTIIPFIFVWAFYFIVLFAGKSTLFTNIQKAQSNLNNTIIEFLFLIFVVLSALVCLISVVLFLLRRELVITNKKVYGRIGLIGTKQFIVPIEKINYISVRYSIIDRIFNSATIYVVPGTLFGIWFRFISNAKQFKNTLENLMYEA